MLRAPLVKEPLASFTSVVIVFTRSARAGPHALFPLACVFTPPSRSAQAVFVSLVSVLTLRPRGSVHTFLCLVRMSGCAPRLLVQHCPSGRHGRPAPPCGLLVCMPCRTSPEAAEGTLGDASARHGPLNLPVSRVTTRGGHP